MSLELDLRVNGEVIGTIRINHGVGCLACFGRTPSDLHEYIGRVQEVRPSEITSRVDIVSHDPRHGAWDLVDKFLQLQPKATWKR